MTALKKYQRLESEGLWRESAQAQRREVTLSFGTATLVINDPAGRALSHWSLPAVERLNPGNRPAVFAPDKGATETIEVADTLMIDAIETIRKSLRRARPRKGRLRKAINLAVLLAILAIGVFWLPGAIKRQTLAVVPAVKRAEIGAVLQEKMQDLTGPACQSDDGTTALAQLAKRVLGDQSPITITVLPGALGTPLALPGGVILLDHAAITQSDDPAVTAGEVLLAQHQRIGQDPLGPLLDHIGFRATLQLLTTGEIDPTHLQSYAMQRIGMPDPSAMDPELINMFDSAKVPLAPFAAAHPEITLPAIDAQGHQPTATAILADQSWVALQGICDS